MQRLADNGGYVLAEEGSRLLFFERRILPTWVVFVLGLVAFIAAGNGIVLAIGGSAGAGAVLLLVGVACGVSGYAAGKRREGAKAGPLVAHEAVVVLDLGARHLLNGAGQVLAPLEQVRVQRSMQATSSSKALEVVWPGGRRVVYRGDPFVFRGGSIDVPRSALAQRGVSTA